MNENHSSLSKKLWWVVELLLLLLISTVAAASLYVYDYTEHDSKFSISCHIMEPA